MLLYECLYDKDPMDDSELFFAIEIVLMELDYIAGDELIYCGRLAIS